jgi:hypothetical protein
MYTRHAKRLGDRAEHDMSGNHYSQWRGENVYRGMERGVGKPRLALWRP